MAIEVVPSERLMLSLGEWAVSDDPERQLVCLGLGSCVAFCGYDPQAQVGGMAHMVLPDSNHGKRGGAEAKFVDLAIPLVLVEMEKLGAKRSRIKIQLVGGAQMMQGPMVSEAMMIGQRNLDAAHAALSELRLQIASEDTGGDAGRTVSLAVGSGALNITSPRKKLAAAA